MGAAVLASGAVDRLWVYQSQVVGTRVNKDLGIQMIESSLNLDTQTVEDAGSGDLFARITDDLDSVRQIITDGIPEFIAAYTPVLLSITWGAYCVNHGWTTWGNVATASLLVFNMRVNADIFSYWLDRIREMTITMGKTRRHHLSHDACIASLADHAVLLHNGTIAAEGIPTEIFAQT